jgi:transcriptional regulator with XRE-family HTH domain
MLNRIKQIMEKEKLSPTQFATEIGVQRSALSHVLSGRNKPSLDFMMKIKARYPDINLDWLLLGKGKMTGTTVKKVAEEPAATVKEAEKKETKDLQFRIKQDQVDETREEKKIVVEKTKTVTEADSTGGDVPKKIILIYPDDTYETYNPRIKKS